MGGSVFYSAQPALASWYPRAETAYSCPTLSKARSARTFFARHVKLVWKAWCPSEAIDRIAAVARRIGSR
jgi:hypothetical protein